MTATPDDWKSELDLASDTFRKQLVGRGFYDDGDQLYGTVKWSDGKQQRSARVSVELTSSFPFAPPKVRIIESDVEPTFHIERDDGSPLCLWTSDVAVDSAPWREVDRFLSWVAGWFTNTDEGWTDDNDADLERYLESDNRTFIRYNIDNLEAGKYYRTQQISDEVVAIKQELTWKPNPSRKKNRGVRRRERSLCFVIDIGQAAIPIRNLTDLALATGSDLHELLKLVQLGSVEYLLIKYRRGNRPANLVIGFKANGELKAFESADSSIQTRELRGGKQLNAYSKKKVVIIGCGAIGSHIAEILYRSGVKNILLVDPERLRPGNIIRHLCGDEYTGQHKVVAVRHKLATLGLDPSKIRVSDARIGDPESTLELLKDYDLAVDTTADMRATAVMTWCIEKLESRLVTVCLQREGGIARVDRFPLWDDETHLAPVPNLPGTTPAYEKGCGSPVSLTPPLSVVKAAALGAQVILDELKMSNTLPATMLEVIQAQPDEPYSKIKLMTSEEHTDA